MRKTASFAKILPNQLSDRKNLTMHHNSYCSFSFLKLVRVYSGLLIMTLILTVTVLTNAVLTSPVLAGPAVAKAAASEKQNTWLTISALTAYAEPSPRSIRISHNGFSGWNDPAQSVVWYGELTSLGKLSPVVTLKKISNKRLQYQLVVSPVTDKKKIQSSKTLVIEKTGKLIFSPLAIEKKGYYRFELKAIAKRKQPLGEVVSLQISGPAAQKAEFNLKPRRNNASVHIRYPVPSGTKVAWFYNEITVGSEPLWSFYMTNGFHRGYFGIQVNGPGKRT